jgi:hypothetical protein
MAATIDVLRAAPQDTLVRLAEPALAELARRKDLAEKHMVGAQNLVRVAEDKFNWPRELPADDVSMKNKWLELLSAREDKAAAFNIVDGRHAKLSAAMASGSTDNPALLRQALVDLAVAELDEAFSLGTIVSPIPIFPYAGALINIPPTPPGDNGMELWSSTTEARSQQDILANAVRAKDASKLSSRAAALMRKTLPKAIDWIKDKIRTKIVSWRLWRCIG